MRQIKSDIFAPGLIDRRSFDAWAADGSKFTQERARARVEEILKSHHVEPLDGDVKKDLDNIVREGEAEAERTSD